MAGDSLAWGGAIATALIGFIFALFAMALRQFSWSIFEDIQAARQKKLRVESCVENSKAMGTFCAVIVAASAVAFTGCVFAILFDEVGSDGVINSDNIAQISVFIGIAMLILLGWAAPLLIARKYSERILLAGAPLLGLLAAGCSAIRKPKRSMEDSLLPVGSSQAAMSETNGEGERGSEDEEAHEFMRTALKLRNVTASEIMTPRIDMKSVGGSVSLEEARLAAVDCGHSRLPVFEGNRDNIVGVLYVKDMLQYKSADEWAATPVSQIMRKPFFIPETKSVGELLSEFQQRKVHIAIALDEYGGTAGLVTIEDILEELVGEIRDEHDIEEEALIKRLDDGKSEVDAKIHVDILNDALNIDIPEDGDYETLGGFLAYTIGKIPEKGQKISMGSVWFTVIRADARKVDKVLVEQSAEDEE